MTNEIEIINTPPQIPQFSKKDFSGLTPYQYLYENFHGSDVLLQFATLAVKRNAEEVGFEDFDQTLKIYSKAFKAAARKSDISNITEFTGQSIELECGSWKCKDNGIYGFNKRGQIECACAHPIMPVERLVNIDSKEVKIKLAFCRCGKWTTIIVDKAIISTARSITALAANGISVTSSTASTLVDYLNDIENLNYDVIPESKSIGRLGYIEGEGFSPYVDDLVFDGDASFRNLYGAVQSHGSETEWYKIACECRTMSVTARILLAASFASPLLSVVGSLPFFVHLWGVDSGTGKTVALMLAASVWGNPAVGSYTQTFNGTQVGQERTAAFLNHLPMCLDELQLTKNSKGQSNFDVYQLAQGVGRARGKKSGGVEMVPTWSCCFLTTGESPLTSGSAGAGAVNRVIDIECTAGTVAIKDGHRVANALKRNYGWAGQLFVEKLYGSEKVQDQVREIYQDFFRELCDGDSTEKQAMAAAAILTADALATLWIFQDDNELTVEEIKTFLASKEAVSAGNRAYDWLCDWVAANANRFIKDGEVAPQGEVYGKIEDTKAYIIRGVFNRVTQEAGFSGPATLSYLKSNNLIEARTDKKTYTKSKKINGQKPECVVLLLEPDWTADVAEEELLPL